jgi:hypothetical protein
MFHIKNVLVEQLLGFPARRSDLEKSNGGIVIKEVC